MAFSLSQKRLILERQNMKCACCSRTITLTAKRLRDWKKELGYYPDKSVPSQAKFHHKVWRSKGGSDSTANGIALCGFCHTRKAHKPWTSSGLLAKKKI
jgi:cytochrome c553